MWSPPRLWLRLCMSEPSAFFASATVGTKGQIVILADARKAMQIKEGDKVVLLSGPREAA